MPETSWLTSVGESLKAQSGTWFVGFVIALLSLFSSWITESIKFGLNRADLRTKYYEEFAVDLSEFIFEAELNVEFVDNGWTIEDPMVQRYNDSITKLRKKEYVYLSWIGRYWGQDKAKEFSQVADAVKAFDKAIHSLNSEFEEGNSEKSTKKMEPEKVKQAISRIRPVLESLQQLSKKFLMGLQ